MPSFVDELHRAFSAHDLGAQALRAGPFAGLDALLPQVAALDEADLEEATDLVEHERTAAGSSSSPSGAALDMVYGALLARSAQARGEVADGPVDDVVAALNALAARAPTPKTADRFAPLGAYLLTADVPAFVDMQVSTADDETVFLWTSGVMALKKSVTQGKAAHTAFE